MIILTTIFIESFIFTAYYPCSDCHPNMAAWERLIQPYSLQGWRKIFSLKNFSHIPRRPLACSTIFRAEINQTRFAVGSIQIMVCWPFSCKMMSEGWRYEVTMVNGSQLRLSQERLSSILEICSKYGRMVHIKPQRIKSGSQKVEEIVFLLLISLTRG